MVGNLVVFSFAADHVLANQYFSILPIEDLHVRPETTVRSIYIVYDSDREISRFHGKGVDDARLSRNYGPVATPADETGIDVPVG